MVSTSSWMWNFNNLQTTVIHWWILRCHLLSNQGEVTSRTFRGMRRSKKTNFRKSAKTKQFSLQQKQMKGIKYSISTEDVGWKKTIAMQKNYQNWRNPLRVFSPETWKKRVFKQFLNRCPEHVRTHILYYSLCNLMQIPFMSKLLTTQVGIERFRTKS